VRKILSIDGGGIRGIIPALVLSQIETGTGKPIAELFDLVAGTSTGGILALGLCIGDDSGKPRYTAADLLEMYVQQGKDIFPQTLWRRVRTVGGLATHRYSHEPLERILTERFGNTPLSEALSKVLVSSYDIQNRQPFFFKSWRQEYNTVPMRYVGRATSAAPTYFEPALITVNNGTRALIDGGVFLNNPAVSAYAEARRIFYGEEDFLVLSVGTGELTRLLSYQQTKSWGVLQWARPILDVVFDGVADAVNYQIDQLFREDTRKIFYRIQSALEHGSDDLDDASEENIRALLRDAQQTLDTHAREIAAVIQQLKQLNEPQPPSE
jgi:hypothetical protein